MLFIREADKAMDFIKNCFVLFMKHRGSEVFGGHSNPAGRSLLDPRYSMAMPTMVLWVLNIIRSF